MPLKSLCPSRLLPVAFSTSLKFSVPRLSQRSLFPCLSGSLSFTFLTFTVLPGRLFHVVTAVCPSHVTPFVTLLYCCVCVLSIVGFVSVWVFAHFAFLSLVVRRLQPINHCGSLAPHRSCLKSFYGCRFSLVFVAFCRFCRDCSGGFCYDLFPKLAFGGRPGSDSSTSIAGTPQTSQTALPSERSRKGRASVSLARLSNKQLPAPLAQVVLKLVRLALRNAHRRIAPATFLANSKPAFALAAGTCLKRA